MISSDLFVWDVIIVGKYTILAYLMPCGWCTLYNVIAHIPTRLIINALPMHILHLAISKNSN